MKIYSTGLFLAAPRRIVLRISCILVAYNAYCLYIFGGVYGIMLANLLTLKEDDE